MCEVQVHCLENWFWGTKWLFCRLAVRKNVLVPEFQKELFVNQLLYNCTFCLTKQFVFGLMFICRWWRRQNRGMSNWNWLPLLCVYLHTLKCYSQWHNFWDIDIKWPKVFVWEKSWRWLVFYFLQEAWKWHNVVCGKREMASSFVFQVKNVDSVVMLLRTLNVLTILLLILDLLIWFNKRIKLNL